VFVHVVTDLAPAEIRLTQQDVYISLICFKYQPDEDPVRSKNVTE